MGQIVTKIVTPLQQCTGSVANILKSGSRKRRRSMDSNDSDEDTKNIAAQTPKRKKVQSTTAYIYQALFKEETDSDISVMALGKIWKLHKVYLCQSPYFKSMFGGHWREACMPYVHIKILDERITTEALDAVFGAMYCAEIEIEPKEVISILAAATLFHLEGIIEKCEEVMIETINPETAVDYYEAAYQYGVVKVKQVSFEWLNVNLFGIYQKSPKFLRAINSELMTLLISSPNLYVMQTEFSLYNLLRAWVYMRLHPNGDPAYYPQEMSESTDADANTGVASTDVIQSYFSKRADQCSFLATADGQQFVKPFQALRTQYLTNHHMDLKVVLNDNIIPKSWLNAHVLSHWSSILKVDHQPEEGPQNLDADVFDKNCMRCGRVLLEPGFQKWRWTGFNFGLDLILIIDSRLLTIRRHHRAENERLLGLQVKRQFMIRASITSINAQRQPTFTQTSEIKSLSLEKNEEALIMLMDPKLVHPLLVSFNLLVIPPTNQDFKQQILTHEELSNSMPISEIGNNCERTATPINSENENAATAAAALPYQQLAPTPTKSIYTLSTASTNSNELSV